MALTWTAHATPNTGNTFTPGFGVWADTLGLFIFLGVRSDTLVYSAITSPDGATWTARTLPANTEAWASIAWSSSLGLLVAVKSNGTNRVYTSVDGINWTARTAAEANAWGDVLWDATLNLFIAISSTGTNRVMTSPDGITWTARSAPSRSWYRIATAGGSLVAIDNGGHSMTSSNGTSWTDHTIASFLAQDMIYAPTIGKFFATELFSNSVKRSTDGITWSAWAGTPSGFSGTLQELVEAGSNGLIAVYYAPGGLATTKVLLSTDGTTFTVSDTGNSGAWWTGAWSSTLSALVLTDQLRTDHVNIATSGYGSLSSSSGSAAGGNTVTITGTNLNGGFQVGGGTLRVRFGTCPYSITPGSTVVPTDFGLDLADFHPATSVSASSATSLTCVVPVGQSLKDVLVYLDGSSSPNVLAWIPAGYTFLNPIITSLDVSTGPSVGGTAITVTGTNLFNGNVAGDPGALSFGGAYAGNVSRTNATTLTCNAPAGFTTGAVDVVYTPPHLSTSLTTYTYTPTTLSGAYTYTDSWWSFAVPPELVLWGLVFPGSFRFQSFAIPDLDSSAWSWLRKYFGYSEAAWKAILLQFPSYRWWTLDTAPDHNGWWASTSDFGGDSYLLSSTDRPVRPRAWSEISTFATGGTAMLGGSPGAGCVLENRLLYPAFSYVNSYPTVRLYNGRSDYQLCTVPATSSGAAPYTVMSMLAANGTVYLSTLDSGSSSSDWVGRVFSLDISSGVLTPLGAALTTGHVPYALAWHNGRLWCGSHRQSTAAAGHVFWIRPGIDTAWTDDHTLASGSVASLLSFQGNLYVGTTDAAATFALLLKRDTSGTWSTVDTGSGGTARASNGWLAMSSFGDKLYTSYWNDDTTPVSKIRKSSDGTSWSTSYTGASGTNRPYIGFTQDGSYLLGIAGGLSRTAAVIRTTDGVTWVDETAYLESTTETALPIFGTVRL